MSKSQPVTMLRLFALLAAAAIVTAENRVLSRSVYSGASVGVYDFINDEVYGSLYLVNGINNKSESLTTGYVSVSYTGAEGFYCWGAYDSQTTVPAVPGLLQVSKKANAVVKAFTTTGFCEWNVISTDTYCDTRGVPVDITLTVTAFNLTATTTKPTTNTCTSKYRDTHAPFSTTTSVYRVAYSDSSYSAALSTDIHVTASIPTLSANCPGRELSFTFSTASTALGAGVTFSDLVSVTRLAKTQKGGRRMLTH